MLRSTIAAPGRSRAAHVRRSTRAALASLALATLVASPRDAAAQATTPTRNSWELIASSGALVPTGAQRGVLEDAALSTAQLSYVIRSRWAVTTMFGWARSRDLVAAGAPKLDVFTWDAGAEARAPRWREKGALALTPFAGMGAGTRSFNHRALDVDATHDVAGYGAVGGELGMGRVQLRVEVRDYVTGFRPLTGGGRVEARNDVVAMVGLRFTRQRPRAE
jgi:hypothetical protein